MYKIPQNMSTGSKLFGIISWRIVMEAGVIAVIVFCLTLLLPIKALLRIFLALLLLMSSLILAIALSQKEPLSKKFVRFLRFSRKRFIYVPVGFFREKEFNKQRMRRMSDTEIYESLSEGQGHE